MMEGEKMVQIISRYLSVMDLPSPSTESNEPIGVSDKLRIREAVSQTARRCHAQRIIHVYYIAQSNPQKLLEGIFAPTIAPSKAQLRLSKSSSPDSEDHRGTIAEPRIGRHPAVLVRVQHPTQSAVIVQSPEKKEGQTE